MKFSILLALALTYTTLTSAQGQNFRPANADKAEQLTKEFAKLTKDSPCENNAQACVEDQFAQCVGGKFQLNSCGGGELKCVVLPLVNKPGTSITCSTEADRKARLADARGENNQGDGKADGKVPKNGEDGNVPKNGEENGKDGKVPKKGKDGKVPKKGKDGKVPKNGDDLKVPDNGDDGKAPKNGDDGKAPKNGDDGKAPKNGDDGKAPKNGDDGKAPKNGDDGKAPSDNDKLKTPPANGDGNNNQDNLKPPPANGDGNLAEIRKQNAAEAKALQKKFDALKPDDKCNDNEVACVDNKFAQCSGGKFAVTDCASGTICAALPLVLKKGTTVACTTEADRDARLKQSETNTK